MKLLSSFMFLALLITLLPGCSSGDDANVDLASLKSEGVSHLLVVPESARDEFDFDAPRDYLPDPAIEWVVTMAFEEPVSGKAINGLLDIPWLEGHNTPVVYGLSSSDGHWTYVNARDAPEAFSQLKIAWSLWDGIEGKPNAISADDLRQLRTAAETKLTTLGRIQFKDEQDIEAALARVMSLPALVTKCDQDVILRLVAPESSLFSGREVWDVMNCLGLDYGDGDLFHWINQSGYGDDLFFTVETSTSPGYFIPQRIAAGEGDVEDLIFYFSIPRSADPLAVYDSMVKAIEYAQQRLGGEIVVDSGQSFEPNAERKKVETISRLLKEAGLPPGASTTLRVF
jgi:cell division protein ZipA